MIDDRIDPIANPRASEPRPEGGYVLAMTALLLVPLMIFAALAVDVGGWYSKASEIQRASDAAALAAVIYMPDQTRAQTAALEQARRNGFDAADPNVDVTFSVVSSQSVRVDITARGELFFGNVVTQDDIEITRFATAEYILPVPMGNPTSALGTGNLGNTLGDPNENMWLAVSGFCSGRQQGDSVSARYQLADYLCPSANRTYMRIGGSWYWASGPAVPRELNPQYDPEGYYLVIDLPPASSGTAFDVQVYDPGMCDLRAETVYSVGGVRPTLADYLAPLPAGLPAGSLGVSPVLLEMRLYAADDTQITDEDNIVDSNLFGTPAVRVWPADSCGWQTGWTIPGTARRGRWLLNYRSQPVTTSLGMNVFAVRVVPQGTSNVCENTGPTSGCPKVFAKDRLSIFAPSVDKNGVVMAAPGAPASFYLAEIPAVHAGKTLEVTLFDPGEGMDNLQIVAPNRTRPPFTYETIDNDILDGSINTMWAGGEVAMTDFGPFASSTMVDCVTPPDVTTPPGGGTFDCLDVSGDRFQNRTVVIRIPIPPTYTCDATDGCWWRIRYEPQGVNPATDRTVWSVRVIGDPVRLTE